MLGTLVNVVAVLAGTAAGVAVGGRFPERMRTTIIDVLALFIAVLGVANALDGFRPPLTDAVGRAAALVVLGSLLVGAVVGEGLALDDRLERIGRRLQDRVGARPRVAARRGGVALVSHGATHVDADPGATAPPDGRLAEGFVVASLVFCVGPLAILGPLQNGLTGSVELLAVKSALDGFAALAFASALGAGVGLSVLPLLAWQGSIALAADVLGDLLTGPMVAALNAVGGVLVVAIALRLLDVRPVRVANLLPALVVAPLAVAVWP